MCLSCEKDSYIHVPVLKRLQRFRLSSASSTCCSIKINAGIHCYGGHCYEDTLPTIMKARRHMEESCKITYSDITIYL